MLSIYPCATNLPVRALLPFSSPLLNRYFAADMRIRGGKQTRMFVLMSLHSPPNTDSYCLTWFLSRESLSCHITIFFLHVFKKTIVLFVSIKHLDHDLHWLDSLALVYCFKALERPSNTCLDLDNASGFASQVQCKCHARYRNNVIKIAVADGCMS